MGSSCTRRRRPVDGIDLEKFYSYHSYWSTYSRLDPFNETELPKKNDTS